MNRLILIGAIAGAGVPFLAAIAMFIWILIHSTPDGIAPGEIAVRGVWWFIAIGVGAGIESASSLAIWGRMRRGENIPGLTRLAFQLVIPWLVTLILVLIFGSTVPVLQTAANGASMELTDFFVMGGMMGFIAVFLGAFADAIAQSNLERAAGIRRE
ncbi:hypothetical protein [uncultured Thiodictyon sp.]|jgi:hypothetical protein|uniref:hypothetical protein n=1 Tax=uncultured Thiodictyon sp. TaxID=1846217 RepID=UPI0025DB9800|nr:hypothetical protein [uncultured Thiodictyon sp.]